MEARRKGDFCIPYVVVTAFLFKTLPFSLEHTFSFWHLVLHASFWAEKGVTDAHMHLTNTLTRCLIAATFVGQMQLMSFGAFTCIHYAHKNRSKRDGKGVIKRDPSTNPMWKSGEFKCSWNVISDSKRMIKSISRNLRQKECAKQKRERERRAPAWGLYGLQFRLEFNLCDKLYLVRSLIQLVSSRYWFRATEINI